MLKLSFQQQILYGFIAFFLCGLALTFTSYKAINSLQSDDAGLAATRKVLLKLNKVQQLLSDAEVGARGYLLSGDESFLEPYNISHKIVAPAIQELRLAVAGNQEDVNRVDTLNFYASQKIEELESIIKATNEGSFNNGAQLALQRKGNLLSKKIKSIIINITEAQNKLLVKGEKQEDDLNTRSTSIIFGLLVLEVIVLLILVRFITSTFKAQKLIEESVVKANEELKVVSDENLTQNWMLTGFSSLDRIMRGVVDVNELTNKVVNELAKHLEAQVATIYVMDDAGKHLKLSGTYAFTHRKHNNNIIEPGEGLLGQAILERKAIVFNNLPADYVKITSGIGEVVPHSLLIQPFLFENEIKGVIELGFANPITPVKMDFVETVADIIGVGLNTAQARLQIQQLLQETQQQAEELEAQQEELRTTNEELVNKTQSLQSSEEELRAQQDELREINSELEEKAEELEERNRLVDLARESITKKAEELELAGKYKSEFLANMSHELRTPLNSILILARILKENQKNNMDEEQIKYASVIHNSGSDLLTLINDILDLSKIESGKIDLTIEEIDIAEVRHSIELLFKEVAKSKNIQYDINIGSMVPERLVSDGVRLNQILKNLLSNAFKFTPENGSVSLNIDFAPANVIYGRADLSEVAENTVLAFSVKDTGIGIPLDKQKAIFEAFQQADGSTSRRFGGTGLGLSISRELASVLGGEIQVLSAPNEGSTFTLYLPVNHKDYVPQASIQSIEPVAKVHIPERVPVTKAVKEPAIVASATKEHLMLIVEDDLNFANILKNYAIDRGFKPILAHSGDKGLEMACEHLPDSIILDIMLPVMDGWEVLKKLKENPKTKNIPVHMMSAGDGGIVKAKSEGAIGFLKKPVGQEKLLEAFDVLTNYSFSLSKVLIVEDHEIQSENLRKQLASHSVHVVQAFNGDEAIKALKSEDGFDCIILDVNLPDISGLDLLDKIKEEERWLDTPVIINTAMEMSKESMSRVLKHTHAMVLKIDRPNDRLMDEVNLFMNKVKNASRKSFTQRGPSHSNPTLSLNKTLANKSVLLVDDDMRNIFALSSALQGYNMNIEIATNGIDALNKLNDNPDTDIVLMDIMMPEMDGYEAMREIRKQDRFSRLPILSLTAKAMKNDREKCIEAGANDYVSKPVDVDKLVSMMKVWLS